MRPILVICFHPRIQLGLRIFDRVEDFSGQEPFTHRAMPPLNLACRGRRAWRGEDVFDPVLPANTVKQHFASAWPEPASEHLAIIGQNLFRDTIGAHSFHQTIARRSRGRTLNHMRADNKSAVVINPRHDLRLTTTLEFHATNNVHLPQLHRP
jgi:hypothetical protein